MRGPMSDKEVLVRLANKAGWEVVAQNGSIIIERGPERIEVEWGTAGIPRKIKRTKPDGSTEVVSQSYIRMVDLFDWVNQEPQ